MEAMKEITECAICADMFTDPRMLPCIHTFCLQCLQETAASKSVKRPGDGMPCPTCGKEFSIPTEGFSGLQRNVFVDRLTEMAKISLRPSTGQKAAVCEICLADADRGTVRIPSAAMYCIECHGNICDRCCREHRRHKQLRHHQIVALGSQVKEELEKRFAINYCEQHNEKQVDMYCNDCKQVLYTTCFAESHQLHKCSDVNKVGDGFRRQIEADLGRIEGLSKEIVAKVKEVDGERSDFLLMLENTEKTILFKGAQIKELVDKHIKCLVDELTAEKQSALKAMDGVRKELERHRSVVDSFTTYCTELKAKGSAGEICRAVHALHERCKELQLIHETEIERQMSATSVQVSLDALNFTDLFKTENLIGKIKRSKPTPMKRREMNVYEGVPQSAVQPMDRGQMPAAVPAGCPLPPKAVDGKGVQLDSNDDNDGYMTLVGRTANTVKTPNLYEKLSPRKEDSKEARPKPTQKTRAEVSVKLVSRLEAFSQFAFGVTKLGDEIFVLCRRPNSLRVFADSKPFSLRKEISVSKKILDPWDVTSSDALRNIVYISDRHDSCIWKVTVDPAQATRFLSNMGDPFTLSLSSDSDLLVVPRWGQPCCRLDIYGSDSVLRHSVPLSTEIQRPLHAVKRPSGHFIVTHTLLLTGRVVISLMDSGGHVTRQFQPSDQLQELNEPCHLALDPEDQRLFVADWKNGRIIVLHSNSLVWSHVVLTSQEEETEQQPWRLFYDVRRRQLITGWDGLPLKVGVYDVKPKTRT